MNFCLDCLSAGVCETAAIRRMQVDALQICHRIITDDLGNPSLVYVHDDVDETGIIGDVHANFCDLLRAMRNTGWPTRRTLVFLG